VLRRKTSKRERERERELVSITDESAMIADKLSVILGLLRSLTLMLVIEREKNTTVMRPFVHSPMIMKLGCNIKPSREHLRKEKGHVACKL